SPEAMDGQVAVRGSQVWAIGPLGQRDSSGTGLAGYRIHATLRGELTLAAPPSPSPEPSASAGASPSPMPSPTPYPSIPPGPSPPNGQLELRFSDAAALVNIGSSVLPSPLAIDGAQLAEATESRLVAIKGLLVEGPTKATSGDLAMYLIDAAGGRFRAMADS